MGSACEAGGASNAGTPARVGAFKKEATLANQASSVQDVRGLSVPQVKALVGLPVACHSYGVELILLFLRMTLRSVLGFRGTASALGQVSEFLGTDAFTVSAACGQMWLLRLGLYRLSQAKEQADDWVWIVDHTIQLGKRKCFVVVGVRRAVLEAKRLDNSSGALTCEDLSVWKIELVASSNGCVVENQLRSLSQTTGQVPREILSDCGGDLSAGIARFCASHPQTIALKDLPHFAANAIKKELTEDSQWAAFLLEANRCKTALRQTNLAFLLPPDLKAKARWMNLDPLVAWSKKVIQFIDSPPPVPGITLSEESLAEKMGWLKSYRNSICQWAAMLAVVAASLEYIRKQGYHRHASRELESLLAPWTITSQGHATRVANRIIDYVRDQSANIPEEEHLLATTEVLESLLGKAKQLQGQQSRSGFTKMILGIAASVSELSANIVSTALSTIKVRDVSLWIAKEIGPSIQSQRIKALQTTQNSEQKQDKAHYY